MYKRCVYYQVQINFEDILFKYQCGFCKGYSAQHYLITLIEKCQVCGQWCFWCLTYQYQAFDCLSNELLIVKLDTYGFEISS